MQKFPALYLKSFEENLQKNAFMFFKFISIHKKCKQFEIY